ncbi:hypothetical protein PBI_BLUEBERRY_62 [Gordonia phage Blueberry]|uniref:Uncharacterized protein n=1 Tax=Gordonia phage Azula TaxID=2762397 RepID=A0A7G8LKV2_9CAUD|nr:membrane protein [Gordonia phage Blueberry]YP_010109989.1 membrane protein [Gordonia phage Azula]QGJ97437.1 hypothetical protein SEA_GAMBINO_65 [Gordonia phage Gambino]QZD97495.1 hypothetical protein SEA_MISSRONA_63 [Gordonia phage MissRona]ANA85524.1 hypothetical protein PBI_BLUEBERRY_62 [Gordonia phage Blueberry]QNJ57874.1 hypothetical protein SEA_AZULA_63 [Gordonia phage Azula]
MTGQHSDVDDARHFLTEAKNNPGAAGYHLVVAQTHAILALVDALTTLALPTINDTREGTS